MVKRKQSTAKKSVKNNAKNSNQKKQHNKKTEQPWKSFLSTVSLLAITIALAFLIAHIFSSLSDFPEPPQKDIDASHTEKVTLPVTKEYELTNVDLFSIPNWNAYQVMVKGISLGDTAEFIEQTLGKPDNIRVHRDNIATMEYYEKESKENNGTALQFFMINNKVRRIIVRKAFNDHLLGSTKIEYDLRKTYDILGIPDQQADVTPIRIFEYHEKGLEVYMLRKKMVGFAFVVPGNDSSQDEAKPLPA